MTAAWPVYRQDREFKEAADGMETMKAAVRGVRNIRTSMNVAPKRQVSLTVVSEDSKILDSFKETEPMLLKLAGAEKLTLQTDKSGIDPDEVSAVLAGAMLYIPLSDLVDIDKEIERLEKEEKRLQGELKRSNGMLKNEKFLSKAPAEKVAEEKEKLEKYTDMLRKVEERLKHFRNR